MRFQLYDRQRREALEQTTLAPYAYKSAGANETRVIAESEHGYRTAFQRDRDRIIHSRAFRRLKHKRQVFLTTESDHHRTRITHTLEVSQLSRTMARALGLNEDLTEAIALGHDLGHTPFGHLGEVVLNEILTGATTVAGQAVVANFGGFKHNYQSVRIVDVLEKKYKFDGLNLTAPVREGMLKHTRLRRNQLNYPDFRLERLHFDFDASTNLEGQVVAICDEIAQRTHDLEDGIRARLVEAPRVAELQIAKIVTPKIGSASLAHEDGLLYAGLLVSRLIDFLVADVIDNTLRNVSRYVDERGPVSEFEEELVTFSAEVDPLQKELNKFIYKEIIDYSRVQWSDELGRKLLFRLFEAYYNNPEVLPEYVLERYFDELPTTKDGTPDLNEVQIRDMQNDGGFFRLICDHIAGMTDHFALREALRLSQHGKLEARDLNLEFALGSTPN